MEEVNPREWQPFNNLYFVLKTLFVCINATYIITYKLFTPKFQGGKLVGKPSNKIFILDKEWDKSEKRDMKW